VVCQDTHLRTPYEVIPLVGGSMDTMPRYLSGGILRSSHLYSLSCGIAVPGYSHTLLLWDHPAPVTGPTHPPQYVLHHTLGYT
jgi:hypothetical protein